MYRDPKSGKTWTGRGKPPNWIAKAKDRSAFLISNDAAAGSPAVEAATAPLWEKVRSRINPVEWRLQAPLIAAINDLKKQKNAVVLAPFTNMPPDVIQLANATIEKIKSGAFHPFTGPIYKQDGTLMVKPGEKMSDADLLGLNWYVKGIDDKVPQ